MPDERIQPGRFEPLHNAHAIEQVALVLQIDQPLDDLTFSEVLKSVEKFKVDLPGEADIQRLRIAIGGPGAVGMSSSSAAKVGKAFTRTRPDGVVENELRVEPLMLTYRTLSYTRWPALWKQARKYFDALIPHYVAKARIAGVSINYVDKFVWQGVPTECRPGLLLRPESKYIAPQVYALEDLWHSHTGAFIRHNEKTKRLANVNVDCIDENVSDRSRRAIAIVTVVSDILNQPNFEGTSTTPDTAAAVLDVHMQQLHSFAKEVFGNIINDQMSKRIALAE